MYIYSIREQPFEIWTSEKKLCVKNILDGRMIGVWDRTGFCKYLHGTLLAKISPPGEDSKTYLYVDSTGVYTFKCRVKLSTFLCPIHSGVQYPYAMSKKWICLLTIGVFLRRKQVLEQDPYDFYFNNWDSLMPVSMCVYKRKSIIRIGNSSLSGGYGLGNLDDLPIDEIVDLDDTSRTNSGIVNLARGIIRKLKPEKKEKEKEKEK